MPNGKEKSPLAKYDEAAEFAYYNAPLREALRKKNPTMFDRMVARKQEAYQKGLSEGHSPFEQFDLHNIIPKMINEGWRDKLSEDEMKDILSKLTPVEGQDPYARFMQLRKERQFGGGVSGIDDPANTFQGYDATELAVSPTTSWEDAGTYYRPTIENGRLVRKTNLGMNMEEALKKFMERTKN